MLINEIKFLEDELKNSVLTEDLLNKQIEKCGKIININFPSDVDINLMFKSISVEPKGVYFPEMYSKLKTEAIEKCKNELLRFYIFLEEAFAKLVFDKSFQEIIKYDESQYLEFKSTLCWDIVNSKDDKKKMGEIIMKSICAFSNSEGGVLLIGIEDNKNIYGLENDFKCFKSGSGTRDDFELHFTSLIINNFSKTFAKDNLSIEFIELKEGEICLVRIKKSDIPSTIFMSEKSGQTKEKFFIRVNNSSREIENLLEFARYIKNRFPLWN